MKQSKGSLHRTGKSARRCRQHLPGQIATAAPFRITFAELAYPSVRRLRPALLGIPLVLGAGAAVWAARRRAA